MASTRLNPLLRWARARQGAVEQPDFGDHGTAFGMELSMAPAPALPDSGGAGESGSPAPAAELTRPAAAAPLPDGTMGMWRRVSGRRAWREG